MSEKTELNDPIQEVLRGIAGISRDIEQNAASLVNGLIILCAANPTKFEKYREMLINMEKDIKEEYPE